MPKHQANAERSTALMARDNRAAKVKSTLKKTPEPLYTVSEVTEYLQVSPSTIYRMIQDGRLASAKIGHGIRFASSNLEQMIEENALETR